jgi:hypothetical protein
VADYKILADWWSHNSFGTQLYIGQAPYRISTTAKEKSWQSADEIVNQIKLNRKYPEISGSMFFSAKFMRQNPLGIQEKLQKRYYRYPALAPSNQRINPVPAQLPANARMNIENGKLKLSWDKGESDKSFVIYQFRKWKRINVNKPENILLTTSDNSVTYTIDKKTDPKRYKYVVTSISKSNAESSPARFND